MNAFESLALALRGHFENPFAKLPPALQQRVVADFAPWSWEGKTPRQRCHRAKQWDYENDPAQREAREGVEALTNPKSPAYSLEETQRLRGDFLPEPPCMQPRVVLQPLEWDGPQLPNKLRTQTTVKESTEARATRLLQTFEAEVKASGKRGAIERVYARELAINPKADRSYIGKQIKKSQEAMTKSKQGDAMFSSLVRDGKLVT